MKIFWNAFLVAGTKPIPVRFEPDLISKLDAVAADLGTNRAALIRHLVKTFLAHRDSGATLPAAWRNLLADEERLPGPPPRSPYTIRGGPIRPLPDQMLNDGANSAHAQHPKGNPPPHNIVSDHNARRPRVPPG